MKCPLMLIPITAKGVADRAKIDRCIEEECAWWNPALNICEVRVIGGKLDDIDTILGQIADKMPHEEQFRK